MFLQVFFDWGHQHEPNGILSYLKAYPNSTVHEVGFVLLDPTLDSIPAEVKQGINPSQLPVIGSSPDGIIVQGGTARGSNQPWRQTSPSARYCCNAVLACVLSVAGHSCRGCRLTLLVLQSLQHNLLWCAPVMGCLSFRFCKPSSTHPVVVQYRTVLKKEPAIC